MLVALTGYGTPEAVERSRQAGFDHHLIKPVNAEALQGIMRGDLVGERGGTAGVGAGAGAVSAGASLKAAAAASAVI